MSLRYVLELDGDFFYSRNFETDDLKGLCKDGDTRSIRYINHENGGKAFIMKAGKLYRSLILETEFGKPLPEQVVTYLCEEFSADWQIYTHGRLPKNKLHVDKDFERIYSSDCCKGNFHSCMVDRELHYFYADSVDASAAYLTNEEEKVTGRFCPKCGRMLSKSPIKGYSFQCKSCDEDFCRIEILTKQQITQKQKDNGKDY